MASREDGWYIDGAGQPKGDTKMISQAIGCDVASGKGGHLFDGGSKVEVRNPAHLIEHLNTLSSRPEVLIAWDSPLTGPCEPDKPLSRPQDLTLRPIEKFFRSGRWAVPPGISVQPYCGCSHWTLSIRALGLPRVGPYSTEHAQLPFRLVTKRDQLFDPDERASVVEVHPALAVWLWYQTSGRTPQSWHYKNIKPKLLENETAEQYRMRAKRIRIGRVHAHWTEVCNCVDGARELPIPSSDDELDSIVAWLLAEKWIAGMGVVLLGNQKSGCFLIPEVDDLLADYIDFEKANKLK